MRLILATKNDDKITEIKSLLADLPIKIITYKNLESFPHIVEDKNTLEGNAYKKAYEIWKKYKINTVADDTGLFVNSLHGKPGVYSSRYAGKNATYKENRIKLLGRMKSVNMDNRKAVFRTVIVLVKKNNEIIKVKGECKGHIGFREKGNNGFGYDSIFYPENLNKSFAELTSAEKNKISHRGKALRKLKQRLINNSID